ncbi:hypothetical protein AJ79_02648 [Helicocarpus griseus UAMH5409]|uniref:alpha-1,2-Mannosidase n=1 Tax=Helicocarpus griseus UAMH5409 TaxID=1447875 RepID=A0A2B7Y2N3_9EURO|nr:hypothetical protein AJ79_02648 [Helicocarpus griseus UAMH5409]
MFRLRRYRVFVVFAIISVIAFIHFSRIRDWSPPSSIPHESAQKQNPLPPPQAIPPNSPPLDYPKPADDGSKAHGFAPEPTAAVRRPDPVSAPTPPTRPVSDNKPSAPESQQEDLQQQEPEQKEEEQKVSKQNGPARLDQKEKPLSPPGEVYIEPQGKGRLEVDDIDRTEVRWEKQPERFPVAPEDLIDLPEGTPKKLPKVQFDFPEESRAAKTERLEKLAAIKESFNHSWVSYKAEAWGHDELRPVYGGYRDPFSGWGASLVDGLDTLWMMGMEEEFEEAIEAVKKIDFATSQRKDIPLFETVIRYLGGLIGAYDVSGGKHQALLDKALELAEILMGAFDTPNRMPVTYYYWAPAYASQPHRAGTRAVVAEIASLSVEFTRLAQITKEAKYYDAIARITNELEKFQEKTKLPGLWPTHIDASGCKKVTRHGKEPAEPPLPVDKKPPVLPERKLPERQVGKREVDPIFIDAEPADYNVKPGSKPLPTPPPKSSSSDDVLAKGRPKPQNDYDCEPQDLASPPNTPVERFTLGGLADSAYEYLPKEYALLGGLNEQYRNVYEKSADAIRKYLLFKPMLPEERDIRFIASATSRHPPTDKSDLKYKYEGTHLACFAGGMFALGAKVFDIEGDMDIAAKLTDGCVWAYESTTTGIMPEGFEMLACESMEHCEWNQTRYYDALDPYEAERKAHYELRLAHQAQLESITSSNGEDPEPPVPQSIPQLSEEKKIARRQERAPEPAPEPAAPASLPARTVTPEDALKGPILLSHEEFANQVIKEERLPPGFTGLSSKKYILRPEAIESVFIMYRVTGDNYWREKGWKMFQAIEAATRTDLANSAIKDVTSRVPMFTNEMESFWFAETLKYFYLLFSDPGHVSLDEYVLNTEAHPHKRPLP